MRASTEINSWPENDLEFMPTCPVCSGARRSVLYKDLTDNVFHCAPGQWSLYQCEECSCAYLDPRPSKSSIALAYQSYYTHAADTERDQYSTLSFLRKVRRLLSNSYINLRYGTIHAPALDFVGKIVQWLPGFTQALDAQYRWLPKPGKGQKLLDVGCGNGAFLLHARQAGWEPHGVDPDPAAIEQARLKSLQVRVGDIEAYTDAKDFFHAITMSHTIEHMHDPRQAIKLAKKMLVDAGHLFVDTPNIASWGHESFKRHWRGLETPRHLVLFNQISLTRLLEEEGFCVVRVIRRTNVLPGMICSSALIQKGLSPYEQPSRLLRYVATLQKILFIKKTRHLEFITLIARKI